MKTIEPLQSIEVIKESYVRTGSLSKTCKELHRSTFRIAQALKEAGVEIKRPKKREESRCQDCVNATVNLCLFINASTKTAAAALVKLGAVYDSYSYKGGYNGHWSTIYTVTKCPRYAGGKLKIWARGS